MKKVFLWMLLLITGTGLFHNVFADYYLHIYDKTNGKYGKLSFHLEDSFPGKATLTPFLDDKQYKFIFSPSDRREEEHTGFFMFTDASHYCQFNVRKKTSPFSSYEYFYPQIREQKGLTCDFISKNNNNNTGDLNIT